MTWERGKGVPFRCYPVRSGVRLSGVTPSGQLGCLSGVNPSGL